MVYSGVMQLKPYLKSLPDAAAREAFAGRCDTTIGHLQNVANGHKPCGTELAVAIEIQSKREVTRQELCPETWPKRWPELSDRRRRDRRLVLQAVKG